LSKKILLPLLGLVGLLLVALFLSYLLREKKTTPHGRIDAPENFFTSPFSSSDGSMDTMESSLFQPDGNFLSFFEVMAKARSGEISLVSELWALRRQCPENATREQCKSLLISFLQKEYGTEDASKLIELLEKYYSYEEELSKRDFASKANLEDKYDRIKELRRQIFSKEDAELIFGLEEAQVEYQFAGKRFLEETKKLSGEERVKQYEIFRKKVYGNYYPVVLNREPAYDRYTMELELRSIELEKLPLEKREEKERELRIRYFGKEGNQRMEKVAEDLRKEREREEKLLQLEKDFLQKNPRLSDKEKEARIFDLRVQTLGGKDAAEEYSRRREAEDPQR